MILFKSLIAGVWPFLCLAKDQRSSILNFISKPGVVSAETKEGTKPHKVQVDQLAHYPSWWHVISRGGGDLGSSTSTNAGGSIYYRLGTLDPGEALNVIVDGFRVASSIPALALQRRKKKRAEEVLPGETYFSKVEKSQLQQYIHQVCVPQHVWEQLEGDELHLPEAMENLAQTGINIASDNPTQDNLSDWQPRKDTNSILDSLQKAPSQNEKLEILERNVLVWVGRLHDTCYGSDFPVCKTRGVVNGFSPKDLAELLIDSSRVGLYNKMSLGRIDKTIFQTGVDTPAVGGEIEGLMGEAKIVINRTQPPLLKKQMQFTTFMYARKLDSSNGEGNGYIVVSRAVTPPEKSENEANTLKSEIVLGVNVLQEVDGFPDKALVTAVTHCNSPAVPKIAATSVGIKGAVDFINDIRELGSRNPKIIPSQENHTTMQ